MLKRILLLALSLAGAFTLMSAWPARAQHHGAERFKNVEVAKSEGYGLAFGCVSGGDYGAMGLHFVNMALVADPALDPRKPEIVTYEPKPNETPQIMGQLLHLFESPNRFGLPDFYTLHLWAWKDNPTGAFVHWHANVYFNGQAP